MFYFHIFLLLFCFIVSHYITELKFVKSQDLPRPSGRGKQYAFLPNNGQRDERERETRLGVQCKQWGKNWPPNNYTTEGAAWSPQKLQRKSKVLRTRTRTRDEIRNETIPAHPGSSSCRYPVPTLLFQNERDPLKEDNAAGDPSMPPWTLASVRETRTRSQERGNEDQWSRTTVCKVSDVSPRGSHCRSK